MNTESVQCISIVYSICPYKYNQWLFRPVEKSNSLISNVCWGKMKLAAFDGPIPKNPYGRKNLPKISYASRVIAHLVTNFAAMATGVGRGKMQLAAFDGPFPKTPYGRKKLPKISYASRVMPILSQISLPWQRGSVGKKCNWQRSMAHSRKTPMGANISQKSLTQAEL